MNIIGVIPTRYSSTRFEGKVLADLLGKPIIQHVWEKAKQSTLLNDVLIACDDNRIKDAAEKFGARVVLTSKDHTSGSDRIAQAVTSLDVDIVVNIQGDEPMVKPEVIDKLTQVLIDDPSCSMATVITPLRNKEDLQDPNVVKVVTDLNGYALYFSRSIIPYSREKREVQDAQCYKHIGLYAYRKEFLLKFTALPASSLEKIERLEQLRALEAGYKIKIVKTDSDTIGVDTPQDLATVEEILKKG